MTYVVAENCIRCKYMDCVEVCPVDCFYAGENMLVINPSECIDCGVCEPECPAKAIVPDSDDRAAEVLASAIAEGNAEFAKMARAPVDESTTALRRYINWYLSQAHRDDIDHGCPVTGFAGDAPRLGAGAQSHFAGGLDDQITILAGLIAESGSLAASGERRTLRERAVSLHCEMLGALVLSRSVAQAATALSNEILENVQRDVLASLDERSSQAHKPRKKH